MTERDTLVKQMKKPARKFTGWMIINEHGNPLVINAQIPIYWYKIGALRVNEYYKESVIKVQITEVKS